MEDECVVLTVEEGCIVSAHGGAWWWTFDRCQRIAVKKTIGFKKKPQAMFSFDDFVLIKEDKESERALWHIRCSKLRLRPMWGISGSRHGSKKDLQKIWCLRDIIEKS